MSGDTTQSTARVSLPGYDEADAETKQLYDALRKSRGFDFIANVFKALGNSPAALERVAAVGEHVRYHTAIDDRLRELMILTVAQETRSGYEWTHHYAIAQKLGIDASTLAAIGTPEGEQRLGDDGQALRFVRLVANNQSVDDVTFDAVLARFGMRGLVDITVLAAYYVMLGVCLNTWQVPCEVETIAFSRKD